MCKQWLWWLKGKQRLLHGNTQLSDVLFVSRFCSLSLNFKQENSLPCKKFFQQIFLCVQLRSIFLFIHCTLLFCRTGEVQGHVQGISWSMKEILKESDYKQHLKVQLVLCYFRN
uniref:Uncharacterized protein n=1 Tax=Aegilops tauschii subsp. strangulata TaxID=200361 RepID=A0A452ZS45_AEGTS